jgi:hypothetical protein
MADREADQAQADHLVDTGVLGHDLDSRRHSSDGTPMGTKPMPRLIATAPANTMSEFVSQVMKLRRTAPLQAGAARAMLEGTAGARME